MEQIKPFITSQQHFQGIKRTFLPLIILAFVFIFITNTVFSTVAAGQEPLSIKVGAYANHPKIFMDANGKVSGFWPDLMEHIAETENWMIEYAWGTWNDGLDRLINKKIDIMPDVAFTEKRNKLYAFSEDPVFMSWTRAYVNKENTEIQSITDLKNKKIAALKGSVNLEGSDGLREIALGFNLNCTFLELDNYTEVFKAIEENRADAGITNRNFGNKNAKKFQVKKTPILFQPISMKFAFPKNAESTPYLAGRINYHIKQLKQDENSIYYRLLKKYFEAEIAEKTVEVFPRWLSAVLKSGAALFVFFILVIIASRIQVKRKTNEIRTKSEALQISEERYRVLFETAKDAIFLTDETGKFVEANQAACESLGYTKAELLRLNIREIDADPRGYEAFLKARNGQVKQMMFEVSQRRKDGTHLPVEITGAFFTTDGQRISLAIARNITKRKQVEEQLRNSLEQLRNLSSYLQSAREQERTNIAREIHDELGQALTALKMDLSWLDKRLPEGEKQLFEKIKSMSELIHTTILTVQRILTELRPGLLDDFGLMAAIEWQAGEFQKRTGIQCEIVIENEDIILDQDRSTAIFRIFQETLTNIARHANATSVKASLKEDSRGLALEVKDNGKGITKEQVSGSRSFGLMGIRERALVFGGKVEIKGAPGKGTTVTVTMPTDKGL